MIKRYFEQRNLILEVNLGTDKNGKSVSRKYNFRNIRPNATDTSIHAVAVAISKLIPFPTDAISIVEQQGLLDDSMEA
ncbi:DUF1659 domain-containing protein [Clostridium cylindrosporum]|uniref:DUF1659 domain-containing protein n=1 Tax=Clostridium cylindrosporum DSM 605 TaxID=1121307 RepID=A0A0J8G3M9_CLOCY|nr:DUF1659 domain-containing protein [Clostridium cylindrosporum]KMT22321.1 hypothetical protein CLCY_17c00150 [Clostridium cylindrosporum DSM 605]